MENKEQQRHSETIKTIEQSLLLLKNKIEQMHREEARNIANIDKVYSSSIPFLKNKFSQTQNMIEIQKKKQHSKCGPSNDHKLKQDKTINQSRQALIQAKVSESQQIKEMSRKNNQIIESVKEKRKSENRKKKEQVQEHKLKSKQKVEMFHIYKKYDLRKRKQNENAELAKRLRSYHREVQTLEKKERQAIEKMKKTQFVYKSLRLAIDILSKMKQTEFMKLASCIGIENIKDINEQNVDRILNYVNAKERSQSLNNFH